MKCKTCKKRMQLVSVSHDFVIKGKDIKVVNIPAEQCSGGGRVEVSEGQSFEIRPPIRATFSCFADPKVMLFHASMKRMTF